MNKPLIFAIRGAVGFGSTTVLAIFGFVAFFSIPLGTALGATVLFYGTANWKRAAIGFGIASILAAYIMNITLLMETIRTEGHGMFGKPLQPLPYEGALINAVIWATALAILGGIGGYCKRPLLAVPGAISFALSGSILGFLALISSSDSLVVGVALFAAFPVGGALFGTYVGWSETKYVGEYSDSILSA